MECLHKTTNSVALCARIIQQEEGMLANHIQELAAKGRSCSVFDDVAALKDASPLAIKAALPRLHKKGEIAMPCRGFYVIVPPEYRAAG